MTHLFRGALLCLFVCGTALRAQGPILGDAPTISVPPSSLPARAPSPQATGPNWYDISNRQLVRDSWNQTFVPTSSVPIQWTGDVASNNPGTTSQAYKDAVATRINWFRAMAGVPGPIVLNPTYNAKDQKAALMFSSNRDLSHFPPPSWVNYSQEGAEAAGKSNICAGFGATTDVGCVLGYIIDLGQGNEKVGHRTALLYPPTEIMGTGDVPQSGPPANPYLWANAIWVQDNPFGTRPATREEYVAWPPPGFVPYHVVSPRWSFSFRNAQFNGATVTMTRNGTAIPVRLEQYIVTGCPPLICFPENTLVWVPDNQDANPPGNNFNPAAPAADTPYTVTISNVIINGTPRTFTYTVTVFNPATGGTPSGPVPVSLTPTVSSGASQVLTAVFSAPAGVQTLDVVNVLINKELDGRQACYLAYSRPQNALYIVADNGDSTQISGKAMDGAGTVANSQCSVALATSSATGSGTTLTLVLNLTFAASFAGNKVAYLAARDLSNNNSGWNTVGVHAVPPPPSTFPNPTGVNPSSGTALGPQSIAFSHQDQTSANNLQTVWALINTAIDGRSACYVAYYRPGNQIFLYPDNGDGAAATSTILTGNNSLSNSQCTVSAQGSSVQSNGNTLTVTLAITFKTAFGGFRGIWLAAQTLAGAVSPWQALGAWKVPSQ